MEFTVHTKDTAPDESRPMLEKSAKEFGRPPALHGILAESPPLLEAYRTLHLLFQQTAFDAEELTVIWQSINVEHECRYCVPGHTLMAENMGVSDEITRALREETPLPSPKLEALRAFTLALVRGRGRVSDAETEAFAAAGYGQRAVLEILLGLSQKVISNYANHLAQTPVTGFPERALWEKVGKG